MTDSDPLRTRDTTQLMPLWNILDLGDEESDPNAEWEVSPYDLLPSGPEYSHYMGSLTTPPCTEVSLRIDRQVWRGHVKKSKRICSCTFLYTLVGMYEAVVEGCCLLFSVGRNLGGYAGHVISSSSDALGRCVCMYSEMNV